MQLLLLYYVQELLTCSLAIIHAFLTHQDIEVRNVSPNLILHSEITLQSQDQEFQDFV